MPCTYQWAKARYALRTLYLNALDFITLICSMSPQDQAHLPNERISLANLRRGKSVVEKFLVAVAGMSGS